MANIKVRVTQLGFDGLQRRQVGEVFWWNEKRMGPLAHPKTGEMCSWVTTDIEPKKEEAGGPPPDDQDDGDKDPDLKKAGSEHVSVKGKR